MLDSLPRISEFITASSGALGMPPGVAFKFRLAADEACTNIAVHGPTGPGARPTSISLELAADACGWSLTICDDGPRFDPTALPPPDLTSNLRRRRAGGLGVHLIRSTMDRVTYSYVDGCNVLTLAKCR